MLLPTPLPPRMQKKLPAIRCEFSPRITSAPPAHIGTRPPGLSPRVPARPCGSRAWGEGAERMLRRPLLQELPPTAGSQGTGQVAGHAAPDPHRRRHGGQHGMCLFPEGGKDSLGSPQVRTFPPSRIRSRSAMGSTSSSRCSVMTMVAPRSRWMRPRVARKSEAAMGSSWLVGSSE